MEPDLRELTFPDLPYEPVPDEWPVTQIRKSFAKSARAVWRLPGQGVFAVFGLVLLIVLVASMAFATGAPGYRAMSPAQFTMSAAVTALLALALAGSLASQMTPAARQAIAAPAMSAIVVSLFALTALLLYHDPENATVQRGLSCLGYGAICALISGAFVRGLAQPGLATNPAPAALVGGTFCGLTGAAALMLHCPIQNAQHVIVWHAGVIVLGALAGWCFATVTWNVALWIVQVLLAVEFVAAGAVKFLVSSQIMSQFLSMPVWFLYFVGVMEILGAIGLIAPRLFGIRQELTPLAAAGLLVIMMGALSVTISLGHISQAPVPAVTGLLCGFLAWGRWDDVTARFWPNRMGN